MFDNKYPNAEYLEEVEPGIMKGGTSTPCWQCDTPTTFIQMDFESYLCSPECVDKAWAEYCEAMKIANEA